MSAVEVIRGAGGGKGGGGSGRVAVEAPDSLRSKQFARILDLISEGEIEGLVDGMKSVYLDDTPIMNADGSYNFQDVVMATTTGTQIQGYVPGFNSAEAEHAVGVEVKQSAPVTRTITLQDVNAVRVTLSVPQLTQQNTSNGDLNGASVEVAIDVQTNGGGFVPHRMRVAETNMAVAGGIATTTTESVHASITVSWTGVLSYIDNPDGWPAQIPNPAMQYCSYVLKYREVGVATWTTLQTGTFSGSPTRESKRTMATDSIEYEDKPPVGSITFEKDLTDGIAYEFTVEKTDISQVGSLGISGKNSTWAYTDVISGKTVSKYQRSYNIKLTGTGPWDIRVRRVTPDSVSTALQDKTFWDSYTEVIEQKFRYPNSALVGISIDAAQFKSIPTRGYDVKLLKVRIPSNYNPITRTYAGNWDGTFAPATWTDNPVWCWYDLVTNERYGLGDFIDASQIDKWGLYKIAKYCDEFVPNGFGGMEPRFTCNMYLQTREDAYRVISNMASIFRAMTYWATGSIFTVQDAPSDPIALFTAANVVDGMFGYSGTALRARHTVALVTWNDPSDAYRQKVEYVEDHDGIAKYGVVQTEIVAVGCTSRGQAHRIGKWMLYSERMETEVVTFKTGLEGSAVYPGAVIKTQDSARSGKRFGGRIMSALTSEVTIDNPVVIEAGKTYTLSVMLPNGTVEERTLSNAAGSASTLIPVSGFSEAPQKHAIWVVSASDLAPETWRVISASEREGKQIEVVALKHHPEKYALVEQGVSFDSLPVTAINLTPAAPASATATDSIYTSGSGVATKITLSWETVSAPQVRGYIVRYRRGSDNWTEIPEVRESTVDIMNATDGETYELRVYTVNALGKISTDFATVSHLVVGKMWPPGDVTGFTAYQEPDRAVLAWSSVADIDLAEYEVRRGTVWDSATVIGRSRSSGMKILPMLAGNYTWLIKAIDTSGNYSLNPTSATLTVSSPGAVTAGASVSGKDYVLTWSEPSSSFTVSHYEIRQGSDWGGSAVVTKTSSLSFKAPIDWVGSRTFRIKAVDIAGNVGTEATVVLNVAVPDAPSVLASLVMAKAQLEWTVPSSSVPIAEYEVRHGASWAAGTTIGRISGTSIRIPIDWIGSRTFWVASIDLVGNVGATSSVVVSISAPAAPVVSGAFVRDQTVLTWTTPSSSLPIEDYEIGYGAVSFGRVKGTTFSFKPNWVGGRTFWVKAYDLNGNVGASGECSLNITAPSAPTITQQTIDNNVLLYWTGSVGTLPIETYELRRGPSWDDPSTVLIGKKSGGFTTVFETTAGTYTYWVAGIDSAGNYGVPASASATVAQPPDYVLQANYNSSFSGTKLNAFVELGALILPVNTTETLEGHFTSHGWTTPQNQIDAGYPVYIQPGSLTGYYEEVQDYGTLLAATKVTVTPTGGTIAGSPTISCTISTSQTGLAGSWTDYVGQWQVYATNFRFVKVRVTVTGDLTSVYRMSALNIRLDVKLKNDAGSLTVNAADVGGTQVNFTEGVNFLDVTSITVTPKGTTPLIAIYDFVDAPNPTGFKVLLFDNNGTRQSGSVSWSAKGY